MSAVVRCFNSHAYQLLAGLGADAGGGGGEVGAVEDLVAARAGERRDEVVEPQELSCTFCESMQCTHAWLGIYRKVVIKNYSSTAKISNVFRPHLLHGLSNKVIDRVTYRRTQGFPPVPDDEFMSDDRTPYRYSYSFVGASLPAPAH
jgi:RNA polymerase subunit RPABC4/transcription elongation factor Spt4